MRDALGRFIQQRITLADKALHIQLVRDEAGQLLEELARRRDGLAPQTLDLRILRTALDHVSPPAGAVVGLTGVDDTQNPCEHEWTDMRNEDIESGEWCRKCGAIRAGNATSEGARS